MPPAIQIGPLMLAADRALAVLLIAAFMVLAGLIARKLDRTADQASLLAIGAGILAARIGYVAKNWEAFAYEPASILAIWQGGFSLAAGLAGALGAIVLTMRQKRSALVLASTALLLSGMYSVGSSLLTPAPRTMPTDIALQDWSGKTVALSKLRGRPYAINLWASWCLPCRREMPMLVDAASKSAVPILLVNSGEERTAAERFLRANNLPSRSVYLDRAAALAAETGAAGYPATLFINAAGQIETVHLGELSRAILADELRSLERGDSK